MGPRLRGDDPRFREGRRGCKGPRNPASPASGGGEKEEQASAERRALEHGIADLARRLREKRKARPLHVSEPLSRL